MVVALHVSRSTSPKMKSFSSAENEDDEREWAHTLWNVRHSPSSVRPAWVRSTAISVNVNGWIAALELIEPAA